MELCAADTALVLELGGAESTSPSVRAKRAPLMARSPGTPPDPSEQKLTLVSVDKSATQFEVRTPVHVRLYYHAQ